jgi:hypothetical protein
MAVGGVYTADTWLCVVSEKYIQDAYLNGNVLFTIYYSSERRQHHLTKMAYANLKKEKEKKIGMN